MDIILNKLPDEYEKNKTLWIYEDNIPVFEKYNQFKKEVVNEPIKPIKKEVVNEPIKQSPINLIINKTFTANVMKNEVRQKIIDFITEPEFSKAFGSKKSSEIVVLY